VPPDKDKTLA